MPRVQPAAVCQLLITAFRSQLCLTACWPIGCVCAVSVLYQCRHCPYCCWHLHHRPKEQPHWNDKQAFWHGDISKVVQCTHDVVKIRLVCVLLASVSRQYAGMQANKEFGAKGKRVLNDDSIIHCGMDVQRRVREAHLQVCFFPLYPGCDLMALSGHSSSAVLSCISLNPCKSTLVRQLFVSAGTRATGLSNALLPSSIPRHPCMTAT